VTLLFQHGDFGETCTGKRTYSGDHRDGPEQKKMHSAVLGKSPSFSRDESIEKYRCPKCCYTMDMTESQFRVHLLEESESSSWLCHICSKASYNFMALVKHYSNEHGVSDALVVVKNAIYDTKVTDLVSSEYRFRVNIESHRQEIQAVANP